MLTSKTNIEKLNNTTFDASLDAFIDQTIAWVSGYIYLYTGVKFETNTGTRDFDVVDRYAIVIDPVIDITKIELLDENNVITGELKATEYNLYPLNNAYHTVIRIKEGIWRTYPIQGRRRLRVSGDFAVSTTIPPEIEWVATAMASDILMRKQDTLKTIKSQTIGEHSVTFDDVDNTVTDSGKYKEILNFYRQPVI